MSQGTGLLKTLDTSYSEEAGAKGRDSEVWRMECEIV